MVGPSWKPPPYPVEVLLGRLRGEYNEGVLLEQWVGPDDKNSSANILQVRRQSKVPWSTTAQYNNWIYVVHSRALYNKIRAVELHLGYDFSFQS